jgi:uncharacterized YccA/Bax inhibitor family protein
MAYKTGNPALNKDSFNDLPSVARGSAMTLEGTSFKSIMLLVLSVASGAFGWQLITQNPASAGVFVFISIIVAFLIGVITIFVQRVSPLTAPLYAVVEGFAVGAISQIYNEAFNGIVLQALLLTAGIFLAMLLLYLFRIIRATENFKLGVVAATGGIALYYLGDLVARFFGKSLPLITSNSWWGIGFTVLVIIVAAFNLVVDFDFIERGVAKKVPKYMEWYASFGLFVTVVWLYLEILRLLAKIRSR